MNMTIQERYVKAKAELAEAQRDKIRFKLEAEKGKYILAAEAIRQAEKTASRIKTRLLALPAQISPALAGAKTVQEIYARLTKAVVEVLNELADSPIEEDDDAF